MIILSLVFIQISIINVVISKNNVCRNYLDYFSFNKDHNKNCMYNPDMDLEVPQLLEKYFGKYDVHEIPTEDGYFVTTFRVPRNNSRGAILLRHSAVFDSYVWVGCGEESVAYFYWKNGFEIWLSNRRGTHFSSKHVEYTTKDSEFWNFSFHESGIYDLRASLKYIYKYNSNVSPAIITYSLGCSEVLVYSSLYPEEAAKLTEVNVLITPPTTFRYSKRKYLSILGFIARVAYENTGIGSIFGREQILTRFIHAICTWNPFICIQLFNIFFAGWSLRGQDPKLIPQLLANWGANSVKTISHLGQSFFSGKFTWYDYKSKNLEVYGTRNPPEYPVWKILAPTYLVYVQDDGLVPARDTDILYETLSESAKKYGRLYFTGMNHIDLMIGKRRNEVYIKVLDLLNDIFPL